uniref:Uncharacterized protein n=1 Tax=Oryza nivara TaxID=4536 RepID=A0A0E0GSW8_ORYNI
MSVRQKEKRVGPTILFIHGRLDDGRGSDRCLLSLPPGILPCWPASAHGEGKRHRPARGAETAAGRRPLRSTRVAEVGGRREDGVDDSEEGADELVREVGAVGLELGVEVGNSISKVLWMATLHPTSLPNWNRMRISVNIITQNRAKSLRRLLASLRNACYVGDEVVPISFNMDSRVDTATLNTVNSFDAEPVLM